MRLLAIRGENLASLAQPFELDFRKPPLAGASLFAITGPTGSGKSTILDALTVPLYHRLARFDGAPRMSQPELGLYGASDPFVLLRRGSTQGYAEVEFQTGGQRYRARTVFSRARGKFDGTPQREDLLFDGESGLLLANKTEPVRSRIAQLIGLDYTQFTRAVLLAQNQFQRFLYADDDQRAQLLEELSASADFGRIGRRAHERAEAARRERERLEEHLALIAPADGERVQAWNDELARLKQALLTLTDQRQEWRAQALRISLQAQAQRQHIAARAQLHAAQQHHAALASAREQLAHWQRLAQLRAPWALVQQARDALASVEAEKRSVVASSAALDLQLEPLSQARQRAQDLADAARRALIDAEPRLAQWQALATSLSTLHSHANELRTASMRSAARLRADQQGVADDQRALAAAGEALLAHAAALDCPVDTDFEQRLGPLRARIATLPDPTLLRGEIRQLDAAIELRRHLESEREQLQREGAVYGPRTQRLAGLIAETTAAVQAAEQQLQRLQRIQRAAQSDVEALRAVLEAGEPCPVCGAREHPGRADTLTVVEQTLVQAQAELSDGQRRLRLLESERAGLEATHHRAVQRVAELSASEAELRNSLARAGEPAQWPGLRQQLEQQLAELDALSATAARLEQAWQLSTRVIELRERCAQSAERLAATAAEAAALATRSAELERDIAKDLELQQSLFAGQPAATVTAELETSLARASAELSQSSDALITLRLKRQGLAARLDAVDAELLRTRNQWFAADERLRLSAAALTVDLEGLDELPNEATVAERTASLAEADQALAAALAHCAATEAALSEHRIAADDLDEASVNARIATIDAELEQLTAARARLQAEIDEDLRRRADYERVDGERREAVALWERRAQLQKLIGSADGKRFRIHAQMGTLDVLLDLANNHLARLRLPVTLARVPQRLVLAVQDSEHEAGLRRIETLSGGEAFMASLALALAMRELASTRLDLGVLFIDEGFGALDRLSLDLVLGRLERIAAGGTLIGVISHVDEMAERIRPRVAVVPVSAGRSVVSIDA